MKINPFKTKISDFSNKSTKTKRLDIARKGE